MIILDCVITMTDVLSEIADTIAVIAEELTVKLERKVCFYNKNKLSMKQVSIPNENWNKPITNICPFTLWVVDFV